jgi:hypothetical protein
MYLLIELLATLHNSALLSVSSANFSVSIAMQNRNTVGTLTPLNFI